MLVLDPTKVRFPPGQMVITRGAQSKLTRMSLDPLPFIVRHLKGDFGELCDEDKAENESAIQGGRRIFSSYLLPGGDRIYVITEWDRSVTTLLLPIEY